LVELPLAIVKVKLKVVELVLKEAERGVTVHHHVLKLLDLDLELGDQSTPAIELVTGLTKLLVSQLDGQVQSLSLVNKLSGGISLESLEMVEAVQAQCGHLEYPDWVEGRNCVHVGHPVKPKWVGRVVCRKQPEHRQNNLQRVLRAESGHRPHSGGLPSVQQTVSDHLGHNRLPPVERVLRNNNHHAAMANPIFHEVMAIVERWLGVTGCTQDLPETARKSVPVQTS